MAATSFRSRSSSRAFKAGVGVLGFAFPCAIALAQPAFYLMGNRGPGSYSTVTGLSRDGKIAVGHHDGSLFGSFTWTPAGGRRDVLDQGYLTNISRDGEAIVGFGTSPVTHNPEATRVVGGVATYLGTPAGFTFTSGLAASAHGKAIAGIAGFNSGGPTSPFRWTESGGMQELTGPDLGDRSVAQDISDDGKTIVGTAGSFGGGTIGGFVWREGIGESLLPDSFFAEGVSADGRTIVGFGGSGVNSGAVRWTDGVPKYLGTVPGWRAEATDVSDDGGVVIGRLLNNTGTVSFVWTPDSGMLIAQDYFRLKNIPYPSDVLGIQIYSVSGDGYSFGGIFGAPSAPQGGGGFVATIPAPSAVAALLTSCVMRSGRRRRES